MASGILLISTNRCDFPYPVFPLGLAQVDTALRRAGHTTRWLDCQCDATPLAHVLAEYEPDWIALSLRNIDDVVFKRRETYFGALLELCRVARAHSSAPLVLGGSGFSIFPERLLELSGADFGIAGEGEGGLVQLLAAVEREATLDTVPGLMWREQGRLRVNPRRPLALSEAVGFPERPPRLVEYYLRTSSMLNVQTQRGCAFECCYCTYPLLEGRAHRRRAPEEVAEEFEMLQRLGARYVFVVDSVFNSSPTHVLETAEALIRREVKLAWGCFLRPQGLTAEQMGALARAGLTHIEFGSDSFCDRVLEAYGKRFAFDDILEASELARAAKIDYCHFLIAGGPGETLGTLRETYRNSTRLIDTVILALPGMRVYPGTPLFHAAAAGRVGGFGDDLLEPHFFFSPDLTADQTQAELNRFAAESPNWIVNEPNAAYYRLADRLRQKGVVGPLWSYLSLMQRVLPRPS